MTRIWKPLYYFIDKNYIFILGIRLLELRVLMTKYVMDIVNITNLKKYKHYFLVDKNYLSKPFV
jgi:hypothetical protein